MVRIYSLTIFCVFFMSFSTYGSDNNDKLSQQLVQSTIETIFSNYKDLDEEDKLYIQKESKASDSSFVKNVQKMQSKGKKELVGNLASVFSFNLTEEEIDDAGEYLSNFGYLLLIMMGMSDDDQNKVVERLSSQISEDQSYGKKIIVAKKVIKDLKLAAKAKVWKGVEEPKNLKRQAVYKKLITGMTSPKKEQITVNFMWIYNKVAKQDVLFPTQYKRAGKVADMLGRLNEWANDYTVNVWYDSKMISNHESALKNTQQQIAKLRNGKKIHLKNIRDLSIIRDNEEAFSQDRPVYFRSDLGRVIATFETLSQSPGRDSYFLYADFKMPPIPYDKLMDPETIYNLNTYAITLAKGGNLGFENGFHIIGAHNKNLLKAIKLALIDLNLLRAKSLNDKALEQVVYDSYPYMLMAFYALEEKAEWDLAGVPFNKVVEQLSGDKLYEWFPKTGDSSFDKASFKIKHESFKEIGTEAEELHDVKRTRLIIPTKFWRFPKSHFG